MDLTEKILNGLRGRIDITVSHHEIAGVLRVVGASNDTIRFGWKDMPESMKVENRAVYCCKAEWSADPIYVFDDEVEVVDAPAHMVVEAMMDIVYSVSPSTAERMWHGEDGEDEE